MRIGLRPALSCSEHDYCAIIKVNMNWRDRADAFLPFQMIDLNIQMSDIKELHKKNVTVAHGYNYEFLTLFFCRKEITLLEFFYAKDC